MSCIRQMVLQSQNLLTAGPKTMTDTGAGMPSMGGRRRPVAITKSLPTLLDGQK